ncbi:MAG: ASCH domain-containing protein [Limisphaerales bacterium]
MIPQSVQNIWQAYCTEIGKDRSADFYEPFHFHDNEQGALELAQLVLAGVKRGTASLVWTYKHDQKRPPWPGCLSVMTDWHGTPLCIIETRKIEIVPFEEVTAEFAAIEGEGDKSLRYWSEGHWNYFTRECKRIGKIPDRRMPVFCEQFEVVFTPPANFKVSL